MVFFNSYVKLPEGIWYVSNLSAISEGWPVESSCIFQRLDSQGSCLNNPGCSFSSIPSHSLSKAPIKKNKNELSRVSGVSNSGLF